MSKLREEIKEALEHFYAGNENGLDRLAKLEKEYIEWFINHILIRVCNDLKSHEKVLSDFSEDEAGKIPFKYIFLKEWAKENNIDTEK